jgi:peptide/nickel transport system permease protein
MSAADIVPITVPRRRIVFAGPGRAGLTAGAILFGIIAIAALLAPWVAPYDAYGQDLANRLVPPAWDENGQWVHLLGTDKLGRDVLSRLIFGARISLAIGMAATVIGGLIGVTLGMAAGYFRGRVDLFVNFLITVRLSIPVAIVALACVALFGGSISVVIAVLGGLLWDRFAVVTRTTTLQLRDMPFVQAATAIGSSPLRIITRDMLPNILAVIIVVATQEFAHAILMEATLSFLGFGVQAPMPSWGLMLAEGKQDMLFAPFLIAVPGVALVLLVLALTLLGDALHRRVNRAGS